MKYIVGVVFVIAIACYCVKIKDYVYIKQCGDSLPLKIIFNAQNNLPAIRNNGSFSNLAVQLFSAVKYDNKSRLLFQLDEGGIEGQIRQYVSYDRGYTWQNVDRLLLGQSDVKSNYSTRLVSHVDGRVIYECYSICKDGFSVSTDGGETWTHVNPVFSNGDVIRAIQFMDTGMHSASRVYARIWTNANKERIVFHPADKIPNDYDFYIGISDDYGRHFSLLPYGIIMLTESRNNPLMRYALILSSHFNVSYKRESDVEVEECLAISKDEGKNWEVMKGSEEIIGRKLYASRSMSDPKGLRTWKQYPEDYKLPTTIRPMQIESDPTHPGYIYVLTGMGLFISRDTGKTFRYVDMTDGWLYNVDRIAVDPLDGRYLYGTVGMEKFYRSSDYGCTWELIPLPNFQQ